MRGAARGDKFSPRLVECEPCLSFPRKRESSTPCAGSHLATIADSTDYWMPAFAGMTTWMAGIHPALSASYLPLAGRRMKAPGRVVFSPLPLWERASRRDLAQQVAWREG
jgi:hypothetical protein